MNKSLNENGLDQLINSLWAPLEDGLTPNVYMVADGARDKRIEPMLINSKLEYSCLYSGNMPYRLKRAAPHIIKLDISNSVSQQLLSKSWGKSWGIFLITSEKISMSTIRNDCRKITMVKTHDNRTVVFRYQDPRVLRKFLPIANPQQLKMIFASNTYIAMESDTSEHLIRFQMPENDSNIVAQRLDIMKNVEPVSC